MGRGPSKGLSDKSGNGFAQLPVLAGIQVDAVYVARDDHHRSVQKIAPVLSAPLADVRQARSTLGYVGCGNRETLRQIVGPEHEGYQIQGLVRFQIGDQMRSAVLVASLDRVVLDRGRSVQLFLDDAILLADLPSQNARPAHILRELFPVLRVGALGVRIPIAQYRSHSSPTALADLLRANIHGIFRPSQMEAR
jgi:hypothetical protein